MTSSRFGPVSRRTALGLIGAGTAVGLGGIPRTGWASGSAGSGGKLIRSHGYSFYGELQYPADFPHLTYVNPNAPKGGTITLSERGTFDGFNRWSWKSGNAEVNSSVVAESMFGDMPFGGGIPADNITDSYGLIAESVEYPEDQSYCIFHMRPEARFRDGSPLTAHDAAFTHNLFLEQAIRSYARAVKERITSVEVLDDHTIKYTFADGISRRSLIDQVGGTPIFSKAWYEETGERLDEGSLKSPMASGPYQLDDYELNRYVVYKRNPDYWGWHLPINQGRHNFDYVRFEYFADDTAEFEAFKAGEVTFRPEGSTKRWAIDYDFPAVENGDVVREEILLQNPPSNSGIIFNTLKAPLDDKTVRQALSLLFNFEWVSKSLQYGLTTQRHSFSQGTEVMAEGLPEGKELAFLKSLGDLVPEEMLTEPAVMAHSSNPDKPSDRKNKRKALKLLEQAGWRVDDAGALRDASGNQMTLEFLLSSATSNTASAIITAYVKALQDLGIDAKAEKVDSAQMQKRYLDKDYQMLFTRYNSFVQAGTGLRQMFGSETAEVSSYNPATLRSPLVDAIITAALDTTTREDEITTLTALDRALRHERIMIHAGYVPDTWLAYYDFFEHPENLPPHAVGFLDFWWINEDKYAALKSKGVLR
ncbi:extracellular solute-binding protein [Aliiroseovarius crassostreae]|uniref:extracellular solute-binding protein n=1 Tax=Aliiroseovarius crassostreae TaxID=154981 RepID=UPI0022014146|nr:extracellular solute-binding protein [Aliiroseovarius crassostreae]UWQ10536.1 extracellular solute-binding protein [Aliiroseovarius crassostreae]